MSTDRPARSCLLLASAGLLVGVATSFAQQWLDTPWDGLANAASPWLAVAWLVGLGQRSVGLAAVAGTLTCVGEVLGYYSASAARGFGISESFVAFWLACALTAGPLFGASGQWARQHGLIGSIGAAAVPATFLGEAVGSYAIRLGYAGNAWVFGAIGALATLVALARTAKPFQTGPVIAVGTAAGVVVYGYLLTILG